EAAHIVPYIEQGPHATSNGLLLRADFHKLFDLGMITVTPDYRVEVSPRIKEAWFNGKAYYSLHGQRLAVLPESETDRLNPEYLRWHHVRFVACKLAMMSEELKTRILQFRAVGDWEQFHSYRSLASGLLIESAVCL